ncbi:MAG: sarcosine oxidase subunit gamma family protein [Pseudomonadota bacterium]
MAYDVTVERLGLSAVFDLKGERAAVGAWLGDDGPEFPSAPNTASFGERAELLWTGPDHWLYRAPLEMEESLLACEVPDEISIAHVSDTFAAFMIEGADANEIMSIACPLDLHASSFPENGATYTEAFGLKALVCRRKAGFQLFVERSFGDLLADYLTRAIGH